MELDDADGHEDDDDLGDDEGAGAETFVTVEVSGLSLYTHHGVSDAEREIGQRLVVDLRIDVGECDAPSPTASRTRSTTPRSARSWPWSPSSAPTARWSACARRSPTACSSSSALESVWVKAAKPEPPIPLPVEEVSVEVWREPEE